MTPQSGNMTKEESEKLFKESYENDKNDLIKTFHAMGFPNEDLGEFLSNSLKCCEKFLREDGYIV